MARKRVTPREFFDAMERNELPKATAQMVRRDQTGAIIAACAYGQAALHLRVDPDDLYEAAKEFGRDRDLGVFQWAMTTNDTTDSTVAAIARYYKSQIPDHLLDIPFRPVQVVEGVAEV